MAGGVALLEDGETAAASTSAGTSTSGEPALVLRLSDEPMEFAMKDVEFVLMLLQSILLTYVVLKEAGR